MALAIRRSHNRGDARLDEGFQWLIYWKARLIGRRVCELAHSSILSASP
jgi:hypothetical protein